MNKNLVFTFLLVSFMFTGCAEMDSIENSYKPGGALADKHEGTMALANLSNEQLLQLIPIGMDKSEVASKLGKPIRASQNGDGTSNELYRHAFNSYQHNISTYELLEITYNAQGKVIKTEAHKG